MLKNNAGFRVCTGAFCFSMMMAATAGTADDVAKINEDILRLEATQKRAQLLANIEKLESEAAMSRFGVTSLKSDGSADRKPRLPVVRSIESYDHKYSAVLALSSGETFIVNKGTRLPGGYVVSNISANAVMLNVDGKDTLLSFGFAPEPAPIAGAPGQSAVPGVVGTPPMQRRPF